MERLLNEHEAAELLGLSVKTLRKHRLTGEGAPFRKLGRTVRYAPADLRAFVADGLRRSTSDRGRPAETRADG